MQLVEAALAADRANRRELFALGAELQLRPASRDTAVLAWQPGSGWEALLPDDDRRPLVDLYLPICSATSARPIAVGHLGQSLDGFIATNAGESQYVTGPENLLHMHRMRALCDAVVVGPGVRSIAVLSPGAVVCGRGAAAGCAEPCCATAGSARC